MTDSPTGAAEEWLSPSAALNRLDLDEHEPGQEVASGREAAEYQQLRHGVTIGPFGVLLPRGVVSEVVRGSTVYPIPKTADWVKGLLNLGGNLVPVFDLASHFDGTVEPAESPEILAVGKADQAVALIVSGIPKVASTGRRISHSTLPLPEGIRNYVHGAFMDGENMWLELDLFGLIESFTDKMER